MNRRQKQRLAGKLAVKVEEPKMGKEQVEALSHEYVGLKLGSFDVPGFTRVHAAFGADLREYPPMDLIPDEFKRYSGKYQNIVSALFFNGGRLADHNIQWRKDIDPDGAMIAVRSWLCSFAPQHEHKTATVAWALSEWTEPLNATATAA